MAIAGMIISFVVIIALVQRKTHLYAALLIGAAIVGLTAGLGPSALATVSLAALTHPATIDLMLALLLISMLGAVMQELGLLAAMVELLQVVLRSTKLTIMFVPSIIGSLLVTGGAILSAPTVRELGAELKLPAERLSAINLLFRHGWFFVYPLVPAFVLITSITGVPVPTLMLWQLPLAVAVLTAGYFTYLHKVADYIPSTKKPTRNDVFRLLTLTSPIWVSLTLTVALNLSFPLACFIGLCLALIFGKASLSGLPSLLYRSFNFPLVASGAGIMIFKDMTGQVAALPPLIDQVLLSGLPPQVLFIVLPFIVGFLSSSNTSAIAMTMPLLLPVMQSTDLVLFGAVAGYSASFIGYFVSPLHLCQVVTLAHFKCDIIPLYREYRWPLLAVALTMVGISVFI